MLASLSLYAVRIIHDLLIHKPYLIKAGARVLLMETTEHFTVA